jgi:phosphoribosyl-dephospho-CoA transferase
MKSHSPICRMRPISHIGPIRPMRPAIFLLPHDLMRLASPSFMVYRGQPPEWVAAALRHAPYVVMRRARLDNGLVPVGIRGSSRSQRFAAWLSEDAIQAVVRPEDIAAGRSWKISPVMTLIYCALDLVEGLFREFTWGPTGSVGFQLASGIAVTTSESDLDIIVRAPHRLPLDTARRLRAALATAPVRVDIQLETPAGAVALAEYAHRSNQVLARSLDGPRFVADPWS